jgi:NADPH:quinone reductase-like Zn-dependent oxidoreductase
MKAAVYTSFGPPEVLHINDVEDPVPKDDEVLIRVRAASVNPLDSHLMRGKPYIGRILFGFGLRKPKNTRPGVDVAGRVEAVGGNVTQLKPGDEVFGSCHGAFAEYVCASESALVTKPNNVTFEQAASAPLAAYTALQAFRDKGHMQPGHKVLINGAAGGVGTFAVQIAKSLGADVTGVCSTRNVEMVRSIGADWVIDYTHEDFTKSGQRYDLIFDLAASQSLSAHRRVLHLKGTYILAGAVSRQGMMPFLALPLQALVLSPFTSQHFLTFIARRSRGDLIIIRDLMEAGKVTPVIDKRYKLSEAHEAIRYLAEGHARGKVVITLDA